MFPAKFSSTTYTSEEENIKITVNGDVSALHNLVTEVIDEKMYLSSYILKCHLLTESEVRTRKYLHMIFVRTEQRRIEVGAKNPKTNTLL